MKQTAAKLGIPYTTYVSYERGDREPDSEKLIRLSDFFDCSIDYLLGRSTEQTKPNMNCMRKRRKELGLTMLEVEKAVGVSRSGG